MVKMITEIKGDIIKLAKQGKFDAIAHGCNCKRNFGAGVAKQIAIAFPEMSELDRSTDFNIMGMIDYTNVSKYGFTGINCYTQFGYGKPFTNPNDTHEDRYLAIERCFKSINSEFRKMKIGIPLIGCGLAGLRWDKVKEILQRVCADVDLIVVRYE